jgi:hypothetical protein
MNPYHYPAVYIDTWTEIPRLNEFYLSCPEINMQEESLTIKKLSMSLCRQISMHSQHKNGSTEARRAWGYTIYYTKYFSEKNTK